MGAVAKRIANILGRGESGVLDLVQRYFGHRFGDVQLQEQAFVHAGMELLPATDFPVTVTWGKFMEELRPVPTPAHYVCGHRANAPRRRE